jgi:acetoin:2,6-dichlorophenolindophenol oxidoreductase subunit alpha
VVATNNHYAYSTPNDREFACQNLVDRAIGYGFEGYSIDGTDLNQCLDVIGGAVKRARAGRPPQLVVTEVLRLSGHGEHDDASYVTEQIRSESFARDCLKVADQEIIRHGLADEKALRTMREDAVRQVDEAVATAQRDAAPDGAQEDWCAMSNRELVDSPE